MKNRGWKILIFNLRIDLLLFDFCIIFELSKLFYLYWSWLTLYRKRFLNRNSRLIQTFILLINQIIWWCKILTLPFDDDVIASVLWINQSKTWFIQQLANSFTNWTWTSLFKFTQDSLNKLNSLFYPPVLL